MTSRTVDFVKGFARNSGKRNHEKLSLHFERPPIDDKRKGENSVTTTFQSKRSEAPRDYNNSSVEDGLYADTESVLTRNNVVKPYRSVRSPRIEPKFEPCGRLLEIWIREVNINNPNGGGGGGGTSESPTIQIESIAILYGSKIICRASSSFGKELYKLLIRNTSRSDANLSLRLHTRGGSCSTLPLPLPKHAVKNHKLEIDFAIADRLGAIRSGTVVCVISLTVQGSESGNERGDIRASYLCSATNDPNDPQNSTSSYLTNSGCKAKEAKYFSLDEPALRLSGTREESAHRGASPRRVESRLPPPDNVVLENPTFSLRDVSLKEWFQARHSSRPSSGTYARKLHAAGGRKEVLAVTILRGVEVPLREESATVQPLVEIELDGTVRATNTGDGPAPVWQHTVHFETSRRSDESILKLRLFDRHPVWGLRWLGEADIPVERDNDGQKLERWIGLSPLGSPVMSFGYVQASPGRSYTRIYALIKMDQFGSTKATDSNYAINTLCKSIQRCLVTPYKISGISSAEDAARLAMLLPSLPNSYGPLTPKQALHLNKVDYYGRAALLATLLQGLDLQCVVALGTSQTRKSAVFVLNANENTSTTLWDPENGSRYNLEDNRCPLVSVFRLINHCNIWENVQKSTNLLNLKFDTKSSKDWRPVSTNSLSSNGRIAQVLEPNDAIDDKRPDLEQRTEEVLKEKLARWRGSIGLTTIFNRHVGTMLKNFLSKLDGAATSQLDKKELRQMYRAYHAHGFVLNLRCTEPDELSDRLLSTKIHEAAGPVEFALACHVQRHFGNVRSIWLALVILRSRD